MKCVNVFVLMIGLIVLATLQGCTVANLAVDPYVKISLEASKDLNPDINDRPSPLHVKVLHLTARATFDNLDFDQLYFNSDTLLRGELLFTQVYTLQPGETITEKMNTNRGTNFIAVIAAYRELDKAGWRYISEVSDKNYYSHKYLLAETEIIPVSVNGRKYVKDSDIKQAVESGRTVSQLAK